MTKYSIKQLYLVTKKTNSISAVLWVDPISIRITLWIANHTLLTPNIITALSFIFGIISAIFFFRGNYRELIIGAIFLQLSFLLDSVDGKLARLTKQESEWGRRLDFLRDKIVHTIILIALSYSYYNIHSDARIFTVAVFYYLLLFFNWMIAKFVTQPRLPFTSFDIILVVFLFGPLLNQVFLGLLAGSFLLLLLQAYLLLNRILNNKL